MNEQNEFVVFEFGSFRLDTLTRQLTNGGGPIQLTSKAFETLQVLLTDAGTTVSKSELMDRVWSETSVEENNLTQQISALRKAFGERAGDHKYIVTVPGRGYCFVMPVRKAAADHDAGFRSVDKPIARPETFLTRILAAIRSETIFGYSLAAVYILAICIPAFFVRAQNEARGIKPQSIAILRFRSSDLGDELLGMGIRDTLRAKLGSLDDVTVRPAADVSPNDIVDAGKQAHADVVLTGSIQRDNDRVRVAVEMVDVINERIVWGKTFDDSSSSAFELQDSIAAAVLSALKRPKLHSINRSSLGGEKGETMLAMIDRSLFENTKAVRSLFA